MAMRIRAFPVSCICLHVNDAAREPRTVPFTFHCRSSDINGREARHRHVDSAEERNSGDPEEEQQRTQL